HDIARLGTFLGALVNALVAVLGSPDRPPRHKVLLCLDEMANLGAVPELEKGVSYLQGSGTQLLAVFQNLPQVLATYGPNTPLLASISTQVHYRPHDVTTAEHIAAHLGQTTTIARSWRSQYGLLSGVSDPSDSERARALMTPAEILRLADTDPLLLTAGSTRPDPGLPARHAAPDRRRQGTADGRAASGGRSDHRRVCPGGAGAHPGPGAGRPGTPTATARGGAEGRRAHADGAAPSPHTH